MIYYHFISNDFDIKLSHYTKCYDFDKDLETLILFFIMDFADPTESNRIAQVNQVGKIFGQNSADI